MTELRFPALEDAVVRLRSWRESDIQSQLEAFSDPWFQRFSDWAPATAIEARRHLLEDEQARQRGERLQFALVGPSDDGSVLGGASRHDVELDQGRASVGFWLTGDARGRGVATHAVRLLVRWAFEELGLARICRLQPVAGRAALDLDVQHAEMLITPAPRPAVSPVRAGGSPVAYTG